MQFLLVCVVSLLVPSPARDRWREEWRAELRHGGWRMLPGVLPDALMMRSIGREKRGQARGTLAGLFQALEHDVRYAIRSSASAPGFTLAVVGSLAIGIGATTAAFAVVNATLFRPFPKIHAQEGLVTVKIAPRRAIWIIRGQLHDAPERVAAEPLHKGLVDNHRPRGPKLFRAREGSALGDVEPHGLEEVRRDIRQERTFPGMLWLSVNRDARATGAQFANTLRSTWDEGLPDPAQFLVVPVNANVFYPAPLVHEPALDLLVRFDGDAEGIAAAVRTIISGMDARLPLGQIATGEDLRRRRHAHDYAIVQTVSALGLSALLLAAAGLYGVVSYMVILRQKEIGIRMALGAQRRTVLRLVVRQAIIPVSLGCALGAVAAVATGSLVRSRLYGVSAMDPAAFAAAALLLVTTMVAASLIPARRASRVDPIYVLRTE